MIALFESIRHLEKKAKETFMMSEELLMEHAALAMRDAITERFDRAGVLIVCGSGNNGADGLALSRLLLMKKGYEPRVFLPFGTTSWLGEKQLERARSLGVREVSSIDCADVIVDSLFGSGLNRELDEKSRGVIESIDAARGFKIACDVPSGVSQDGNFDACAKMDLTVTIGAPKLALFNDRVKDRSGQITIADLGIPKEAFVGETDSFLLEPSDLRLPFRYVQDSHKGSYGHLAVVIGDKPGAGLLSAMSALRFGAGLTTAIGNDKHISPPFDLMQARKPAPGTNAIAFGMGLGGAYVDNELLSMIEDRPCVIDADAFSRPFVIDLLRKNHPMVLTPHPKEFALLLSRCGLGNYDVAYIQQNRLNLSLEFSKAFPGATLVLKGANVIIAGGGRRFINTQGSPVLAKGGSGDVLSGMIGALIAQGYPLLDAAIHASLAHALAAKRYDGADYSMLPTDLINSLKTFKR